MIRVVSRLLALLVVLFGAAALSTGPRSGARLASSLDRRAVTQTLIAACTVAPQAKPAGAYGEFEPGAKGAKKKGGRGPAPAPTKPPTPGGAYNPGAEMYGKSLK